ncbi:MAG: UvrD-helicase domain-containing protein [Firmicutes bacterium]|nr:UvrD-helicase domain-containing protein [Bacillota bacterium]
MDIIASETNSKIDLSLLNDSQLAPVLDTEGALLVTAGAGSGKTRLLTYRIAHLIVDKGVNPYNILAITFTNKAGREMQDRLLAMSDIVGEFYNFSDVWMSTFHSMCVSMLRRFGTNVGIEKNFSIYTEKEKEALIKKILKESDIDADECKNICAEISNAKNKGVMFDEYVSNQKKYSAKTDDVAEVYERYEKEKDIANALDFDDLLLKTLRMLQDCELAREHYQDRFKYIHIDEFQDTNTVQYLLVKTLASKHKNIMVVGDEDQGIYSWRGASISNMHDFLHDFTVKRYKLEQNYRSTKKILALANKVIKNNVERLEKNLWTKNDDGEEPVFYVAHDDSVEAEYVIKKILEIKKERPLYNYSDFAILLRINALTRSFEEKCIQYGIKYKVTGGFKFYDRKEIKDILAYLRLTANPSDTEAILWVINFPKRGIGETAVLQLLNYSKISGKNLFETLIMSDITGELPPTLVKKVQPFATILNLLQNASKELTVDKFTRYLIKLIDLKAVFEAETTENESRKENIKELINSMELYVKQKPEATLGEFLQNVSLYTDADEEIENINDCIQIATVHSAKGLEFKCVFIVGLEENIFPISRAKDNKSELEEERRLMYVAITRAEERLYLTYAQSRFLHGERRYSLPSRFLAELDFKPPKVAMPEEKGFGGWSKNNTSYNNYYNSAIKQHQFSQTTNTLSHITSKSTTQFKHLPTKNTTVDLSDFAVGKVVKHNRFGLGTIMSISGEPSNCYAEIEFEFAGKLNLSLNYAPLEIVED